MKCKRNIVTFLDEELTVAKGETDVQSSIPPSFIEDVEQVPEDVSAQPASICGCGKGLVWRGWRIQ